MVLVISRARRGRAAGRRPPSPRPPPSSGRLHRWVFESDGPLRGFSENAARRDVHRHQVLVRHTGTLRFGVRIGFTLAFALAFAESPAVANAAPSAVSADGGTVARLTGPPDWRRRRTRFRFRSGGGGELPGTTLPGGTTPFLCVFLGDGDSSGALNNAATTATCRVLLGAGGGGARRRRAARDRSDALGGRVDAVGGGVSSLGKSAHKSVRGAPFARVTPVSVTAASPVTADWLASPTVTLALRRAGAASQSADRSSCWIGAVGPTRAARLDVRGGVRRAGARGRRRLAPVRLLPDLSAPAAPSAAPVAVAFTVSADGMDAQGRPGGSALGGGAAPAPPNTLINPKRDGVVRAAAPARFLRRRTGDASRRALREYRRESRTRTLLVRLEDASTRRVYASRATRVSGAMAPVRLCRRGRFPRTALGDGGGVFAATVALGFEPRRYAGAARHESRHAPTVVSVTPRVVPAAGGVEITLVGTAFAGSRLPDETLDASQSSLRVLRFGCRFGSVGPVAARGVSSSSATCVSPAFAPSAQVTGFATGRALAARAVPVGFALDPETHSPRRRGAGRRRRTKKMSRRRFSSTARPRAAFTRSRSARSGPSPVARPSTCST